ncbi:MAG: hypothetical protein KU37_07665 [Sulfuricurvum sp. PC08-66]|nr:MAG: hypothetical protein KU37_07665 [Sulfuricurvum sp. PC08-66]
MDAIIFGPILSRRFGVSLGIDVSPALKRCNFDCLYCELDPRAPVAHSDVTLSVSDIIEALQKALVIHPHVDVITLTANGEPTLYPHFTQLAHALVAAKGTRKLLILTNSAGLIDEEIFDALQLFDQVKCSLDAVTPAVFAKIDRPHATITIEAIKSALVRFASLYRGELIIEILVVKGINDTIEEMQALSDFLRPLRLHRIDIGTIDRPPAYKVEAVSNGVLEALAGCFDPALPVHIAKRHTQHAIASHYSDEEIVATLANRVLSPQEVLELFDSASQEALARMVGEGVVCTQAINEQLFYLLCKNLVKKRQKA